MRTGWLAGLIVTGTVLLLGFGQALSNADFIYMCAGAALLDAGKLPVTPYFPPGYPALLWLVVKAGLLVWPAMTALHAGTILSAIGAGLSAGAVTSGARLYRVPPAPALLLGLLAASLPDLAEIAFNPHVDALFTGLALTLIVTTLQVLVGASLVRPLSQAPTSGRPAGAGSVFTLAVCAVLLFTLRWHAVLVVVPCLLALLLTPSRTEKRDARKSALDKLTDTKLATGPTPQRAGLTLLFAALIGSGLSYGALYATSGSLESAAPLQVATGSVYRQFGAGHESEAASAVFTDYAAWIKQAPKVDSAMLLDAVRTNWPQFMLRKAVLGAVVLTPLLALILRRWPPQAHPLILFMLGYSAAVSTTYFTPRASALIELCALLLAASALSLVFTQEEHDLSKQQLASRRLHFKPNAPGPRINAAAFGSGLALALLAGIGYDAWRVQHDLRAPWAAQRAEREAVYAKALELAGGSGAAIYGHFDRLPTDQHMPWCLPGPTFSRLWMDDPRVVALEDELLPEYRAQEVLISEQPSAVRGPLSAEHERDISADADFGPRTADYLPVVLLWPTPDNPRDVELASDFDATPSAWLPVDSPSSNARLWVRTPTSEATAQPQPQSPSGDATAPPP